MFGELMEPLSLDHFVTMVGAPYLDTNGGDNRVDHKSLLGAVDVLITLDGDYIFAYNIEALRMSDACLLQRKWL